MTAGIVPFTPDITAASVPKLIRASKTFTGAANLGAVGDCPLFTTSGRVALDWFSVNCTTDMADTVDGALFVIGVTGNTSLLADWSASDLDVIDAGDGLEASTVATDGAAPNLAYIASAGGLLIIDSITMTISTQAITGGTLEFYILYRPLSANGALSLGTGMVAI